MLQDLHKCSTAIPRIMRFEAFSLKYLFFLRILKIGEHLTSMSLTFFSDLAEVVSIFPQISQKSADQRDY